MTINEFLKSNILKLPLEREDGEDYYITIKNRIYQYLEELKKVDNFQVENIYEFQGTTNIKNIESCVLQLNQTILGVIREYYNGKPHLAFQELKKGIESKILPNIINPPRVNFHLSTINEDEELFRFRLSKEEGKAFERKGIFHNPMTEREQVSSQRFSIPGHPCLYLGSSTQLCWIELGKPELNHCHASLFKYRDSMESDQIVLLDLRNKHPLLLNKEIDGQLIKFLSTWPLIAACSVKVKHKEKYFKPEYIIPQLMLQWIRENTSVQDSPFKVHGVIYSSVHLDQYSMSDHTKYYNIAIPIRSSQSHPFCDYLTTKFIFSKPISWNHLNLINSNNSSTTNLSSSKVEPSKESEAINDSTKFDLMESFLRSSDLLGITPNGIDNTIK